MLRRVIVPLDGSPVAEMVLPVVERLSGLLQTRVVLVRIIVPLAGGIEMAGVDDTALAAAQSAAERAAEDYLQGIAERLRRSGLAVETRVLVGAVAETIVAAAEAADLIAMSTHGEGGLGRWAFGSDADKVVRAAQVPVLLVRADSAVAAEPVMPPIRRILVPLDGSPLAELALPLASYLARQAGARLLLMQGCALAQMSLISQVAYLTGLVPERLLAEAEKRARLYLEQQAQRVSRQGVEAAIVLRDEPVAAEAVLAAVADQQAELIIMTTHGHGGLKGWVLGSVANRILQEAAVPVLLIRAQAE